MTTATADPMADFDTKQGERLRDRARLNRAWTAARDELIEAEVRQELGERIPAATITKARTERDRLERELQTVELSVERAGELRRAYLRGSDGQRFDLLEGERVSLAAAHRAALDRERTVLADLATLNERIVGIEDADLAARDQLTTLNERSDLARPIAGIVHNGALPFDPETALRSLTTRQETHR